MPKILGDQRSGSSTISYNQLIETLNLIARSDRTKERLLALGVLAGTRETSKSAALKIILNQRVHLYIIAKYTFRNYKLVI